MPASAVTNRTKYPSNSPSAVRTAGLMTPVSRRSSWTPCALMVAGPTTRRSGGIGHAWRVRSRRDSASRRGVGLLGGVAGGGQGTQGQVDPLRGNLRQPRLVGQQRLVVSVNLDAVTLGGSGQQMQPGLSGLPGVLGEVVACDHDRATADPAPGVHTQHDVTSHVGVGHDRHPLHSPTIGVAPTDPGRLGRGGGAPGRLMGLPATGHSRRDQHLPGFQPPHLVRIDISGDEYPPAG